MSHSLPPVPPPPPPRGPAGARAARRRRSAFGELVKIVLGGAVGIVLALAILRFGRSAGWIGDRSDVVEEAAQPERYARQSQDAAFAPREAASPLGSLARPRPRFPPPSPETQARIHGEIDAVFAQELSGELSPESKRRLARRIFQLADDARDRPEERFVLLRKAADLAVEAGDLAFMASLVDVVAAEYEFDPLSAKAAHLRRFAESADRETEIETLVTAAKTTIDEALAEDRYDLAVELAEATRAACRRPAGEKYRRFVQEGCDLLAASYARWPAYLAAKRKLASDADNPEANLVVGQWLCLEKGEWNRGLALLAKGGDQPLADLARRDRAIAALGGIDLAQALEIGDAWSALATGDEASRGFLARAYLWYRQAQGKLAGEESSRIERRMDAIARDPTARRTLGMTSSP